MKPASTRERGPEIAEPRASDVRASRIYLLSRGPLQTVLRRGLSIAALVALDVAGLALGLMIALVLRTVVYGDTVFWSLLWQTGRCEWLPFLAPITVLVFLQAGLYALARAPPRRRGASSRRSCSSP